MKHPHEEVLSQVYSELVVGNYAKAVDVCAPGFSFQIAGKSSLAGKYDRETFSSAYPSKLKTLTDGTYRFDLHEILVSDLHATVLATVKAMVRGKSHEFRVVHVWRFEGGKPLAGYEYARDLYAFDSAFAG
jgi:ketosteroid isomerase-like protein